MDVPMAFPPQISSSWRCLGCQARMLSSQRTRTTTPAHNNGSLAVGLKLHESREKKKIKKKKLGTELWAGRKNFHLLSAIAKAQDSSSVLIQPRPIYQLCHASSFWTSQQISVPWHSAVYRNVVKFRKDMEVGTNFCNLSQCLTERVSKFRKHSRILSLLTT